MLLLDFHDDALEIIVVAFVLFAAVCCFQILTVILDGVIIVAVLEGLPFHRLLNHATVIPYLGEQASLSFLLYC